MGRWVFSLILALLTFSEVGESLPLYWIVEEDFIKIGKKEFFEEQVKQGLVQKQSFFRKEKTAFEVIGLEDLENPHYAFLMPLESISSLSLYAPLNEKGEGPLLESCLNFQIFSLLKFLEPASFRPEELFLESFSYLLFLLYDIAPGSQDAFEERLKQVVVKQPRTSPMRFGTWKVLLGSDTPKYLICFSVVDKEDLKAIHPEELFEEVSLKEMIRGKKSGWMKRSHSLSIRKTKK